jgi:8-oxo-dGTP pyrophosphatase MutT (NUDIX family)
MYVTSRCGILAIGGLMINDQMLDEVIEDSADLLSIRDPKPRQRFRRKYLEQIDVITTDGSVIGVTSRGLAHRLGLRHSVVYCLVSDPDDRMLVQERGEGDLDVSVGGHVQTGEIDLVAALSREFCEELGMNPVISKFELIAIYNRDTPLSAAKPLDRTRERRHLYCYKLNDEEYSRFYESFSKREEREDVAGFRWVSLKDIQSLISAGSCADGLISVVDFLGRPK